MSKVYTILNCKSFEAGTLGIEMLGKLLGNAQKAAHSSKQHSQCRITVQSQVAPVHKVRSLYVFVAQFGLMCSQNVCESFVSKCL